MSEIAHNHTPPLMHPSPGSGGPVSECNCGWTTGWAVTPVGERDSRSSRPRHGSEDAHAATIMCSARRGLDGCPPFHVRTHPPAVATSSPGRREPPPFPLGLLTPVWHGSGCFGHGTNTIAAQSSAGVNMGQPGQGNNVRQPLHPYEHTHTASRCVSDDASGPPSPVSRPIKAV